MNLVNIVIAVVAIFIVGSVIVCAGLVLIAAVSAWARSPIPYWTRPGSMLTITCPACSKGMSVGTSKLGSPTNCPYCGAGFVPRRP